MSRLRRADYSPSMKNKTIVRCEWVNYVDERHHALCLWFSDHTMMSFRFSMTLSEEAEICDWDQEGNLSNERTIPPVPITKPKP